MPTTTKARIIAQQMDYNAEIDRQIEENIHNFSIESPLEIRERIEELDKEWDVERTLELNASLVALSGILLSAIGGKKWLIVPALATAFIAQHAIHGWCPPIPLLRKMNVRTRKQIAKEKFGLMELLKKRAEKNPDKEWRSV